MRVAPSRAGAVLGVMKRGDALPYGGRTSPDGWLALVYRDTEGRVTGGFAVKR